MSVQRFRRRPTVVEAVQWTGDNKDEMREFASGEFSVESPLDGQPAVHDKLHDSWISVYTGQWIIRGVNGEFYPIAADVLAKTYQPAGEPTTWDAVTEIMHTHNLPPPTTYRIWTLGQTTTLTFPADDRDTVDRWATALGLPAPRDQRVSHVATTRYAASARSTPEIPGIVVVSCEVTKPPTPVTTS